MPNAFSERELAVERVSAIFLALFLVLLAAVGAHAQGRASSAPAWADISGATVYDREQLWAYISTHAVDSGHINDAEAIAASIEQLYREDGYFLARVEVRRDPRQNLVEFDMREGRVSTIAIEGFEPPVVAKLQTYFDQAVARPGARHPCAGPPTPLRARRVFFDKGRSRMELRRQRARPSPTGRRQRDGDGNGIVAGPGVFGDDRPRYSRMAFAGFGLPDRRPPQSETVAAAIVSISRALD